MYSLSSLIDVPMEVSPSLWLSYSLFGSGVGARITACRPSLLQNEEGVSLRGYNGVTRGYDETLQLKWDGASASLALVRVKI